NYNSMQNLETMITTSEHAFGEEQDAPQFSVKISEVMQEDYGLFVWPCSIVLAEYVWQQRARFSGLNVVELGSGTALPGVVAAKLGADVTLTDDCNRPQPLAFMLSTTGKTVLRIVITAYFFGKNAILSERGIMEM
ncbi:hypothetical protein KI387_032112, partial [Taxus chinensis]